MSHIFVSYKHEDGDFAAMLVRQLEEAGFIVWIDHDRLRGGEDWRTTIDKAIREAFALLVVITPAAKQSEYVTYEWSYSLGVSVKVVPIMLQRTTLHPRLEVLQHLDFTDHTRRPWDRLIQQLQDYEREYIPVALVDTLNAPPAVREAISALDSENADERRAAIQRLARMNHRAARAALSEEVILKDHDWQVRISAIEALAELAEGKAPVGILNALNDPVSYVREAAARALGQIKDENSIPALLNLLDATFVTEKRRHSLERMNITERADGDEYVSNAVLEALGQMGEMAVPKLTAIFAQEDHPLRWKAARALAWCGPEAIPGLIAMLEDRNAEVRSATIDSLAQIGDSRTVPALLNALRDRNTSVRRTALNALGKIQDVSAIPQIIEALQDRDQEVRVLAAEALGRIGNHVAISELVVALRDPNEEVRYKAIEALGAINVPATIPALLESLVREEGKMRKLVFETLNKINSPDAAPSLMNMLKSEDIELLTCVIALLGNLHYTLAASELMRFCEHDETEIRVAAIHSLGKMKSNEAVPILSKMLKDKDDQIEAAAIIALEIISTDQAALALAEDAVNYGFSNARFETLKRLKKAVAVEKFLACTHQALAKVAISDPDSENDVDYFTVESYASILMEMGDGKAITPYLAKALTDKFPLIRAGAARTLEDVGGISVVPRLVAALNDSHQFVRLCAANALARIGWVSPDIESRVTYLVALQNWDQCVTLGSPTVPRLIELLDEADNELRLAAVQTLGAIGDPIAFSPLVKSVLTDEELDVRKAADQALESMKADPINLLLDALHSQDRNVRHAAAEMLGEKDDEILQALYIQLVNALQDEDIDVRYAAACSIGKVWTPEKGVDDTIGALVEALHDKNNLVRQGAADALWRILGHITPIPEYVANALVESLYDSDRKVRKVVADILKNSTSSLQHFAHQDEQFAYIMAKEEWSECIQYGKEIIPYLIKALADESNDVRCGAAKTLGRMRSLEAVPALLEALRLNLDNDKETK